MKRVLILAVALALTLGTAAAALALPACYLDLGVGARAMGMAGAFVAVADDGTAAYWNPAGINQIKVVGITPSLTVNGDFAIPPTSIGDDYPPDLGNLDLQLKGMVGALFKGIGLSLILDADARTYYNDTGTESAGDAAICGTGMLTLAHEFAGVFATGINLKGIRGERIGFDAPNNPATASYHKDTGTGYAADIGVMLKAGKLVRIGAVVENVVGTINWDSTQYSYDPIAEAWVEDSTTASEEERPRILHVGLAVKPPVIGTLIAFQADKPLESGSMTYRIGFEQSVLVVKLRAGAVLNEDFDPQWYTAGLGFKLGPAVLDVGAVGDQDLALQTAVLTAGFTF